VYNVNGSNEKILPLVSHNINVTTTLAKSKPRMVEESANASSIAVLPSDKQKTQTRTMPK
jgi:hypothetical protein